MNTDRKPATAHTVEAQRSFAESLPPDRKEDWQRVQQGFIASRANPEIRNQGTAATWAPIAWDTSRWEFVEGDAPDTVNPSLWRQARLNGYHGLFKVVEGFYQARSMAPPSSPSSGVRQVGLWSIR